LRERVPKGEGIKRWVEKVEMKCERVRMEIKKG